MDLGNLRQSNEMYSRESEGGRSRESDSSILQGSNVGEPCMHIKVTTKQKTMQKKKNTVKDARSDIIRMLLKTLSKDRTCSY